MRFLGLVFFNFLFISALQSQNCNALDKAPFFTSIKLDGQLTDNLTDCSKQKIVDFSTYILLRISNDSLNKDCKKKYADLFMYHKVPFSLAQLEGDKKGRITAVSIYSFLEKEVLGNAINYNPPPQYTLLYNKLTALYGKPVTVQTPTQMDSLFIRERGMTQMVGWYCSNMFLELRVNYEAQEKMLNLLSVNIRSTALDLPQVEKLLD